VSKKYTMMYTNLQFAGAGLGWSITLLTVYYTRILGVLEKLSVYIGVGRMHRWTSLLRQVTVTSLPLQRQHKIVSVTALPLQRQKQNNKLTFLTVASYLV
jgi:hypothetical protein